MYFVLFACTGFGPFGNHAVNSSWVSVQELAKEGLSDDIHLVVEEIPVEYDTVKKVIPELWKQHKPKVFPRFIMFTDTNY